MQRQGNSVRCLALCLPHWHVTNVSCVIRDSKLTWCFYSLWDTGVWENGTYFYWCCEKLPQIKELQKHECIISQLQYQYYCAKVKVSTGLPPFLKAPRKKSSFATPASKGCLNSLAYGHMTPISTSTVIYLPLPHPNLPALFSKPPCNDTGPSQISRIICITRVLT